MSFFRNKTDTHGGIFINTIPYELNKYTNRMYKLYLNETNSNEVNNTLNHIWYSNSSYELKQLIEKFQNHLFFNQLCDGSNNCIIENISEMDEIMYSNSKVINSNTFNVNYYGATSNYKPHHDCEVCSLFFRNTNMYRILIGLTNENEYIYTKFPNYNIGKRLNEGDVIGFDFDKTLHEVVNIDNKQVKPRVLLKLHYLVCEDCKFNKHQINNIKQFYTHYDRFLRDYTKIGTDPIYPHEFALGLSCHYMYYPNIEKILLFYFMFAFLFIKKQNKYTMNNTPIIFIKSLGGLFGLYGCIILFYWTRFRLFNIK